MFLGLEVFVDIMWAYSGLQLLMSMPKMYVHVHVYMYGRHQIRLLSLQMDRTAELIIRQVSVEPQYRSGDIIDSVIAWLQKTSAFLHDVQPGWYSSMSPPHCSTMSFRHMHSITSTDRNYNTALS